jgi:hypothetical protein
MFTHEVKTIRAYNVDGKIFATKEAAWSYATKCNILSLMADVGIDNGSELCPEIVADWIVKHFEQLSEILRQDATKPRLGPETYLDSVCE